jgi:predicted dehydrogenase
MNPGAAVGFIEGRMRFALLGDHPDGLEMADALVASGRHQVLACTGRPPDAAVLRWGARRVADLEEVLADPAIEAVIVAGTAVNRPEQLRRSVQSERHVLCVHPPDQTPEIAYEASLIRNDTGCVLLPLLTAGLHPGVRRLAEFVRRDAAGASPVGDFRLLEVERAAAEEVLLNADVAGGKPSFPAWDLVRVLGGEVAEVSAFAAREEAAAGEPLLLAGRFEHGGLFRQTLLPRQGSSLLRLAVIGSRGRAELLLPLGLVGPAFLSWRDTDGETREESWPRWDPWPTLVAGFEAAVATNPKPGSMPTWEDTVRALELDDAARRSVEKRRTSLLEYPEASEEVGFKGTMTLVGCGVFWLVLLLLILSRWVPLLGWLIVPLLVGFLSLQLLRYALPPRRGPS